MKYLRISLICCAWTFCVGLYAQGELQRFSIKKDLCEKVMKSAGVEDKNNYQIILNFLEGLCNAYEAKDVQTLEKVFGHNVLVVTKDELVVQAVNEEEKANVYGMSASKQYVNTLKRMFDSGKDLNVVLDDIEIVPHPVKKGFYGVTVRHGWKTKAYGDTGYMFLLWDFTSPETPKILERRWRPDSFPGEAEEGKIFEFDID